jgi:hypothetical protein
MNEIFWLSKDHMDPTNVLTLLSNVSYIESKVSDKRDEYPTLTAKYTGHSWYLEYEKDKKLSNYRVMYTCLTCQRKSRISLNHLAKKINKNSLLCATCNLGNMDIYWSDILLDQLDPPEQERLTIQHLSYAEYDLLSLKIKSAQNGKILYPNDLDYRVLIRGTNKFIFVLYDNKYKNVEIFKDITGMCEKCGSEFTTSDMSDFKARKGWICEGCR